MRIYLRELRGGCMFEVNILIQASGGDELKAAMQVDWRKSGALS